jgi:DNA-binding transcriptional regulator GbsR (MarR family)
MKKIIRLSESQLTNIVKRVISENNSMTEKKYKTYSKLLNKLTEKFDWVSKIDVKLSSTADAGGWRGEESKPLLIVSVYFKNYQKIRMVTQFELFDEISFIHDMFFPHLTGDPRIYSDNVTAYFSVKSVFPNGKTDPFPIQIVSGDYDDVSQISESQLTNIVKRVISENNSMTEKNKRFLKKKLGIDFTNGIQQVTSTYDVPMEFDRNIPSAMVNRYLNKFGPMYLFELDGKKYLYLDVGVHEKFIDEDGNIYIENEIPEKLGIDEMGLRFSNILDLYFNEEDF